MYRYLLCRLGPFLFVYLLLCFSAQAINRPDYQAGWLTKESAHFHLLYNARQENLADVILLAAERSHLLLQDYFVTMPKQKTWIVLNDQTDLANGSATVFPYPLIRIHTALPSHDSSINDYQDWYFELVLHEYVHILNLYPANGIAKWARALFGSLVSPNMLLPRWHTEGMAVALETELSKGGRLRSPLYRSYAQIISQEKLWQKFLRSSELHETGIPEYPFGMRPYFFGSWFWRELLDKHGPQATSRFNEINAARIPYFHDGSLQNSFARSEQEILQTAYTELEKQFLVQKPGPAPQWFSPDPDWQEMSPQFSSQGKLLLLRKSPDTWWQVWDHDSQQSIDQGPAFLGLSWQEETETEAVFYAKLHFYRNDYMAFDLFRYDYKNKKLSQLTYGQRLRYPHYRDGKVIAVQSWNGQESLWLSHWRESQLSEGEIVYQAPQAFRISFPLLEKNGDILFLLKDQSGSQQLYRFFTKNKRTELQLGYLQDIRFLTRHQGQIYFLSGHSGEIGLYRWIESENRYEKLHQPSTYSIDFAFSPAGEILVSQLSQHGFHIAKAEAKNLGTREQRQPALYPPPEPEKINREVTDHSLGPTQSYSTFSRLYPHYWFPWVFSAGDGTNFQINTGGADPLQVHQYSLTTGYNTLTQRATSQLSYLNNMLPGSLLFSMSNNFLFFESARSGGYVQTYSLAYQQNLNWWRPFWRSRLAARRNEIQLARDPVRPALEWRIGYNDEVPVFGRQVGTNEGESIEFGLSQYFRTANTPSFQVLHFQSRHYLDKKKLPPYHSLMFATQIDYRTSNSNDIFAAYVTAGGYTGGQQFYQFHKNRGYPRSQLLAYDMASLNVEYQWPVHFFFRGDKDLPVFVRRLTGGLMLDASMMAGSYYSSERRAFVADRWREVFPSLGAELRWESQWGYVLPVNLILGAYEGLNKKADGGTRFVFFVSLPGF